MATKYKYRCREVYRGVQLDIKSNDINDFVKKINDKKSKIDRQILDPNTPLKDFASLYVETYKRESVSDTWYNDIRRIVDNKIVPGIGNKAVGNIKPIEIQSFLNTCSNYSTSYVKKIFDLTRQIFSYGYKNGMTVTDYTLALELPKGKKGAKGSKYHTKRARCASESSQRASW